MTMTATQTARYYEKKIREFGDFDSREFKVRRGPEAREFLAGWLPEGHFENFKGAVLTAEISGLCDCGLNEFIDGCASFPKPHIEAPEGAAFHEYFTSWAVMFYDEEA